MLEEKCKHLGLKLSRNWCSAISVDEDEQKYLVRCQILELESRLAMRDPRVRGWRRIENHFRMALQRRSSRYQFWSQSTVIFECWQAAHVGLSCRCVSIGDDLRVPKNWGNRDSISGCLIIIILLLFITESWSLLGVYFSEQRYGTGQHSPAESRWAIPNSREHFRK
jgi:hypothetical protein